VIHCFSGGIEDARKAVELDFVLGVDGPVTYPKNEELRRAVLAAGLENLVLETDSPYLPPQSLRGKRNEPADVALIADFLAGLFGVPAEAVAEATTRAARDLFRLPKE
ncbi:MAG: TatD family hydrolase, partial [Elusimicrobia bacterium]|nr:TatD family hydrolase [Elusimicrobiota bacterium]